MLPEEVYPFLLEDLFAADGGNVNGVGGKLACVGGYIAGNAGKQKQQQAVKPVFLFLAEGKASFGEE